MRPDIWCHPFSRYLGRELTPVEKSVIARLEKARRQPRQRPIVIVDNEGFDSSALLRSYLDYRLATSPQGATAALYLPSGSRPGRARDPERLPRGDYRVDPRLRKRIRYATYRRPEQLRGSSPAFILMLNAHTYGTFSPLHRDPGNFLRLCRTLFPLLCGHGYLIIHLRADALPRVFTRAVDHATPHRPPSPGPATGETEVVIIDPNAILRHGRPTREGPPNTSPADRQSPYTPIPN